MKKSLPNKPASLHQCKLCLLTLVLIISFLGFSEKSYAQATIQTTDAFKALIENMGGNISSSVSKNTDYILLGDNPGSKFSLRRWSVLKPSQTQFDKKLANLLMN